MLRARNSIHDGMTIPKLRRLIRSKRFRIGSYHIVSQDPNVITVDDADFTCSQVLPSFILIWHDIERVTGYRWKCTSYIRNAPSHKRGHSIDLAPDWSVVDKYRYGVARGSDPVIWKRLPLINALLTLKDNHYGAYPFAACLESDHIHLQVFEPGSTIGSFDVVKWGQAKPIYKDTYQRIKLPDTMTGYLPPGSI